MIERFANPEDETQIKRLLVACELPVDDLASTQMEHFLTLWDADRLSAVVGVEILRKHALLRSLAVDPKDRGRGFASRLVNQIEAYACSRQVEALYLLTTTAEDLFARRGYQKVDRDTVPEEIKATAEFRSLCPSTAVCMTKHLSESSHATKSGLDRS